MCHYFLGLVTLYNAVRVLNPDCVSFHKLSAPSIRFVIVGNCDFRHIYLYT